MSVTWIDGREVAKKWKENAAQRAHSLNGSAAAGKLHTGRTGRSGACAECG